MGEKLIVTAKYGSLEYNAEATPYNHNARGEQYDSCINDIRNQIRKDGKFEMESAFIYSDRVE